MYQGIIECRRRRIGMGDVFHKPFSKFVKSIDCSSTEDLCKVGGVK
jgi:hypothetical protein